MYKQQNEPLSTSEEKDSESFLSCIIERQIQQKTRRLCSNRLMDCSTKSKRIEMEVYLKFKDRGTMNLTINNNKKRKKEGKNKLKHLVM